MIDHRASTGFAILSIVCCVPWLIGAVTAWVIRGRVDRHGWKSFIPAGILDALADISLREPKKKNEQGGESHEGEG